jgi:hypothetical protein
VREPLAPDFARPFTTAGVYAATFGTALLAIAGVSPKRR